MDLKLTDIYTMAITRVAPLEPLSVQAPFWYAQDMADDARKSTAQAFAAAETKLLNIVSGYSSDLKDQAFDALNSSYSRDHLICSVQQERKFTEDKTREKERDSIIDLASKAAPMDYGHYAEKKRIPSLVSGQLSIKAGQKWEDPICKEVYHGQQHPVEAFIEVSGAHIEVDASNWTGRGFGGFTKPRAIVEAASGVRAIFSGFKFN